MRIIAGTARSRLIEAPRGRDTRPTLDRVRENLFNILVPRIDGAKVLDLFSGSGALALEALSRGAESAVLVDHDRAAHQAEARNVTALGFSDRARLLMRDWRPAVETLRAEGCRFDLIFLDPPYAMHDLTQVTEALKPLCAPGVLLVTEHQAGHPYVLCPGWAEEDQRRWGYVGVTMYSLEVNAGEQQDLCLPGQL